MPFNTEIKGSPKCTQGYTDTQNMDKMMFRSELFLLFGALQFVTKPVQGIVATVRLCHRCRIHKYLFGSPVAMLAVQMPHSLLSIFAILWTFLSTKYEKMLTFHFLVLIQVIRIVCSLVPLNMPSNPFSLGL